MKNNDRKNIVILITVLTTMVLLLVGTSYYYGSTLDWLNQHWIIPDYFRQLFYDTKQLIPSFAFNIGAGQNIFNLSYYGLLSPLILISYLFPFIRMVDFVVIMIFLVLILTIILYYYWLRQRFTSQISFWGTLIFLCAGPLLFHSHRHLMFISYLPFTIMSLWGVDRLFKINKKDLLILSVFLTIMTNYYFSVSSILVVIIYAIYKYLETNKKISLKAMIYWFLNFIKHLILPIIMGAIILLPTIYVILSGRLDTNVTMNILEMIIPIINHRIFLCNGYSLGITAFTFYSIIAFAFSVKKERRFLGIVFCLLLLFPIILFILNGFMYTSGKVLIPFIPLAGLVAAYTLEEMLNKFTRKDLYLGTIVCLGMIIHLIMNIITEAEYGYIFDFCFFFLSFLLLYRFNMKKTFLTMLFLTLMFSTLISSNYDQLVDNNYLEEFLNEKTSKKVNSILTEDNSFYRISNYEHKGYSVNQVLGPEHYQATIYSSVANSNLNYFYNYSIGNENPHRNLAMNSQPLNIFYNIFMGNKYAFTETPLIGYEQLKDGVFINNHVYPVGYATRSTISINEYQKLEYPYNIEALMLNAVVKDSSNLPSLTNIKEIDLTYSLIKEGLEIKEENGIYSITAKDTNRLRLDLDQKTSDQIILLSFDMIISQSCEIGDTYITINGITNKLTCAEWKYQNNNNHFQYTLSSNQPIEFLDITFGKGKYQIGNIKTYVMEYKALVDYQKELDPFVIDRKLTYGDQIVGQIKVRDDGYFILSIPYDKGFSITVDDQPVTYEKVNEAFIGFKINKGQHKIELRYKAPYLLTGKTISLGGFMIFGWLIMTEIKRGTKDAKTKKHV